MPSKAKTCPMTKTMIRTPSRRHTNTHILSLYGSGAQSLHSKSVNTCQHENSQQQQQQQRQQCISAAMQDNSSPHDAPQCIALLNNGTSERHATSMRHTHMPCVLDLHTVKHLLTVLSMHIKVARRYQPHGTLWRIENTYRQRHTRTQMSIISNFLDRMFHNGTCI